MVVAGCGLACSGATALARGGGSDAPRIRLTPGCLDTARVRVRIVPREGTPVGPVHIRAAGREAVHLTGLTQQAAVILRLPQGGSVSVTGKTDGGTDFAVARTYRRCHRTSPPAGTGGGGEG
jgi:hypothetical protein